MPRLRPNSATRGCIKTMKIFSFPSPFLLTREFLQSQPRVPFGRAPKGTSGVYLRSSRTLRRRRVHFQPDPGFQFLPRCLSKRNDNPPSGDSPFPPGRPTRVRPFAEGRKGTFDVGGAASNQTFTWIGWTRENPVAQREIGRAAPRA